MLSLHQREYKRTWYAANKDRQREKTRKYAAELRNKMIDKLGGRCVSTNCHWRNEDGTFGCTDRRALQVDHVNGDGYLERNSGTVYYNKVLKAEDGQYQLLCANCNWIKRAENKELGGPIPFDRPQVRGGKRKKRVELVRISTDSGDILGYVVSDGVLPRGVL